MAKLGRLRRLSHAAMRQALVIAVGTFGDKGSVDDPAAEDVFEPLDVHDIAKDIAAAFRKLKFTLAKPLLDVDSGAISSSIRTLAHQRQSGPIVVHFIGHGRADRTTGRYYVAGIDTRPDTLPASGIDICGILDAIEGGSSGPPVLLVLDACESGRAVRYLMGQDRHDEQRRVWVLAAAHPVLPAVACRFSHALRRVLGRITDGAVDLAFAEPFVRLETVRDLVQTELDIAARAGAVRQVAELSVPSTATPIPPFIPNPHYNRTIAGQQEKIRALVPEAAVRAVLDEIIDPEHFRSRASGLLEKRATGGGVPRCLFTGRAAILTDLSAWFAGSPTQPGLLRVVTGSAGSGKSALLGVLACAADRRLAQAAPEVAARLTGARKPPLINRIAVLHARNRTAAELLHSIATQLKLSLPRDGTLNVQRLTGQLRRLKDRPVIALDALDESSRPDIVLAELLLPLINARVAQVLIGTRKGDLYSRLFDRAGAGLIDLDEVNEHTVRGDLAEYIADLLAGSRHYEGHAQDRQRLQIAATAAAALTTPESRSQFLAAGLFVDYLDGLSNPLHDLTEVAAAVPDNLSKLVELRLARLGSDQPWLRPVLAALAYAKGAGMPRTVIQLVAPAFADSEPAEEHQIADALRAAQFYLRRSTDADGTILYRLFHQALDDHLREYPVSPFEPVDAPVLLDRLLADITLATPPRLFRAWDRAEPYLLRHAIEHAADAGQVDELLTDPEFLVHADPDRIYPHLTTAQSRAARQYATIYRASRHVRHNSRRYRPAGWIEEFAVRRDLLSVDSVRWQVPTLAARLDSKPFLPRWSTGGDLDPRFHGQFESMLKTVKTMSAAVTNAGVVVVATDGDGSIARWNVLDGTKIGEPIYEVGAFGAAFAELSGRDVFITGGHQVQAWDVETGQPVAEYSPGHDGPVIAIATTMVSDVPVLVTGGEDGTLRMTDLATGKPTGRTIPARVVSYGRNVVPEPCRVNDLSVTWWHDTMIALVVYSDGTFQAWNLVSGTSISTPVEPLSRHGVVARTFLRTVGRFWFASHWWLVNTAALAIIDDRLVAITGHRGGWVQVWDLLEQRRVGPRMTGHTKAVTAVSTVTTAEGTPLAATSSRDGSARVWNLSTHHAVGRPLKGRDGNGTTCVVVRSGDRTIAATGKRAIQVWDLDVVAGEFAEPQTGHDEAVQTLSTGVWDGRAVVISGGSDAVRLWDQRTGSLIETWPLADGFHELTSAVLASYRSTQVLLTAHVDPEHDDRAVISLWSLSSHAIIRRQAIERENVLGQDAVIATVDGRLVVFAHGPDATTRAWDVFTGEPAGPALEGCRGLDSLSVTSYEGRSVAAVASDEEVRLFDLDTGHSMGRPMKYSLNCWDVTTLTIGGRPLILTGTVDERMVRIWDPIAGRQLRRTLFMPEPVTALCGTSEGDLVVGMKNGDVTMFSIDWPESAEW